MQPRTVTSHYMINHVTQAAAAARKSTKWFAETGKDIGSYFLSIRGIKCHRLIC